MERLETAMRKEDEALADKVIKRSDDLNILYTHITDYFAQLFASGSLTEDQANLTTGIMYVFGDLDRMNDLCAEIAKAMKKRKGKGQQFSDEAMDDIMHSFQLVEKMFMDVIHAMVDHTVSLADLYDRKEEILDLGVQMRRSHVRRIREGQCDARMTEPFNEMIHAIDRMGNCCINIADALGQSNGFAGLTVVENE